MLSFFILLSFVLAMSFYDVSCDTVCRRGLECWECDSRHDAWCGDPFERPNPLTQAVIDKHILTCNGCCVKIMRYNGSSLGTSRNSSPRSTGKYFIRTCTGKRDVNIAEFFHSHQCYTEIHSKGRLCFCEDELCNNARGINQFLISIPLSLFCFIVLR